MKIIIIFILFGLGFTPRAFSQSAISNWMGPFKTGKWVSTLAEACPTGRLVTMPAVKASQILYNGSKFSTATKTVSMKPNEYVSSVIQIGSFDGATTRSDVCIKYSLKNLVRGKGKGETEARGETFCSDSSHSGTAVPLFFAWDAYYPTYAKDKSVDLTVTVGNFREDWGAGVNGHPIDNIVGTRTYSFCFDKLK